jgi:hypothetical protein
LSRPTLHARETYKWLALAAVALAATAYVAAITWGGPDGSVSTPPGTATGSNSDERVARDLGNITRAVNSEEPSDVASVLVPELANAYLSSPSHLIPAGSSMEIDPGSFDRTSAVTATARAIVSEPQPLTFTLLLYLEGKHWLIAGTVRIA